MKITVEFLSLPNIAKMVGGKKIAIDFTGNTVADLIQAIGEKYGAKIRQFLLDDAGQLDTGFAVAVNNKEWIRYNQISQPLQDGDHVAIMMLAAGG